jgi:hypothetical protein
MRAGATEFVHEFGGVRARFATDDGFGVACRADE